MSFSIGEKVEVTISSTTSSYTTRIRGYSTEHNEYIVDYFNIGKNVAPLVVTDTIKRILIVNENFILDPKLKNGDQIHIVFGSEISKTNQTAGSQLHLEFEVPGQRYNCILCGYGDDYTQPNLKNGQHMCWSCRSTNKYKVDACGGLL